MSSLLLLVLLAGCDGDARPGTDGGPSSGADATTPGADAATPQIDGSTDPPTGGAIGDPCTADADCTDPPDAECFTRIENPLTGAVVEEFPNGFCSKGCESSEECGGAEDVVCASSGMSSGGGGSRLQLCTPSCEGPADCRSDEGYGCQMLFGFGFCAPP
ncbi:MAG TPA: hypothetical protein RMH99_00010 [Sandaracinaceae bacterium LLY-WYZ-13_1]|nr:hypothetical protein [Sandaracinaceae bacterium LLY-WYZ-13_1]